jgi:hypothetical protein
VYISFYPHFEKWNIVIDTEKINFMKNVEGRIVFAKNIWTSSIYKIELGEALKLFRALNWILELQRKNTYFPLNLKQVVDSIGSLLVITFFNCVKTFMLNLIRDKQMR